MGGIHESSRGMGEARSTASARDHLANERTFLAWVRTELALIGLGFVLARMGLFLRQLALASGHDPRGTIYTGHDFLAFGIVFLVVGTALAGWSGWVYHRTRRAIDAERYEPDVVTVTALAVIVVVGGLLIVALVLWRTLAVDGL
jgi:putative membrane protein